MAPFNEIATGVGVAIGAGIALLGAPNVYLGIKKSQVEIRKLELEAIKLETEERGPKEPRTPDSEQGLRVSVDGVENVVSISTDGRLLGPLLLLLDFVTATIMLTVAGYFLSFGGVIFSPLLAILGIILFTPIYREAKRLKRTLTPVAADAEPKPSDGGA